MYENEVYSWQPIDSLPLFSASIDVMEIETKLQYSYLETLKSDKYLIDKNLIKRILHFYKSQINLILFYQAQLTRWNIHEQETATKSTISALVKKVNSIQAFSQEIISTADALHAAFADENKHVSLDKKILFDYIIRKLEEKKHVRD